MQVATSVLKMSTSVIQMAFLITHLLSYNTLLSLIKKKSGKCLLSANPSCPQSCCCLTNTLGGLKTHIQLYPLSLPLPGIIQASIFSVGLQSGQALLGQKKISTSTEMWLPTQPTLCQFFYSRLAGH